MACGLLQPRLIARHKTRCLLKEEGSMKRLRVLRLGLLGGLAALFLAPLAPCPARAGLVLIGSITSGGYTFTNFDFSPLTPPATGSNVNGISNTGQVAGTT